MNGSKNSLALPLLVGLVLGWSTIGLAQSSDDSLILSIIGQHKYQREAKGLGADIFFQKSLDQSPQARYAYFLNKMSLQGVDTTIFEVFLDPKFPTSEVVPVAFHHPDEAVFLQIAEVLAQQRIPMKKVYYWIPGHQFEEEDQYAVRALEDALSKADVFAAYLGKKVVQVLNIDDRTSGMEYYYVDAKTGREEEERIEELLEKIGQLQEPTQSVKSLKPSVPVSYSLKVTFKLQ
ncbi:MAG: hypothetical protein AAF798_22305 [Bacteroidota bacterium]